MHFIEFLLVVRYMNKCVKTDLCKVGLLRLSYLSYVIVNRNSVIVPVICAVYYQPLANISTKRPNPKPANHNERFIRNQL